MSLGFPGMGWADARRENDDDLTATRRLARLRCARAQARRQAPAEDHGSIEIREDEDLWHVGIDE